MSKSGGKRLHALQIFRGQENTLFRGPYKSHVFKFLEGIKTHYLEQLSE